MGFSVKSVVKQNLTTGDMADAGRYRKLLPFLRIEDLGDEDSFFSLTVRADELVEAAASAVKDQRRSERATVEAIIDAMPPDRTCKDYLQVAEGLHPKTRDLVDRFSAAMAEKLLAAQTKYDFTDGWADPGWETECRVQLMEHIAKGDPRDVANYCAFMWHHEWSTAPQETAKPSSIAQRAAQMILDRDAAGQAKYGMSMDRTDLSISGWLQHATEELADGVQYLIKAKEELLRLEGQGNG